MDATGHDIAEYGSSIRCRAIDVEGDTRWVWFDREKLTAEYKGVVLAVRIEIPVSKRMDEAIVGLISMPIDPTIALLSNRVRRPFVHSWIGGEL